MDYGIIFGGIFDSIESIVHVIYIVLMWDCFMSLDPFATESFQVHVKLSQGHGMKIGNTLEFGESGTVLIVEERSTNEGIVIIKGHLLLLENGIHSC